MQKNKLPFWQRMRLFQKVASGIMVIFCGLMILVAVVAYMRTSGSTGLDMAQVQKLRYEANRPEVVQK